MDKARIGKFQVLGTLGTGAHSTILHIRRNSDARQYALKIVPIDEKDDEKFLEQAENEHAVGQMFQHSNLVKIHILEKTRDWLFRVRKVQLLIEYVNGLPLDKVTGLRLPHLLQIFAQIASGMAHMHRRGAYHADLKPNNVMLSRVGEVKIIDYGLAWIKGEPKDRVQGTPEYMAPEQVKKSIVNEQTDIYNFGATMYRLVTWQLPPNWLTGNAGAPLNEALFNKLLTPVDEIQPNTPKRLVKLIHSCLSYKPNRRPERMSDIKDYIDKLAAKYVQSPDDDLDNMNW
ncbi:MAG: serine/threonine protein kinase [Gemmataceae bacterium]